jgi:hypothetical protein
MQNRNVELIVNDFSKIFVSQREFNSFLKGGNSIYSLLRSKLIAVTVNPFSPNGILLDSDTLREEMKKALGVEVYDVKKLAFGC